MKIAIIGIGNVGGTLGPAWVKAGHKVIYGVRDPNSEKVKTLLNISHDIGRRAGRSVGRGCEGGQSI